MCPEPIQTLKSEPTSQEWDATGNGLEKTNAMPALPPERDTRSRQSEIPAKDNSTAVEGKNDTRKPEHESIEREHTVREQVRPQPGAGAQPSATSPDHPNKTNDYGPLKKALTTMDPIFVDGLVRQLLSASARGDNKFDIGSSFTLAVLNGTTPKDELDAMHLAQMTAICMAIIRLSGDLARAEYVPHVESITRAINQLARTYTAQLEARKRYLTGGEQKVTVQNVSVNDGGQAIVTNVNQATGEATPDEFANTTPALTDNRQAAMEIIDESERMPIPLRAKSKTRHSARPLR